MEAVVVGRPDARTTAVALGCLVFMACSPDPPCGLQACDIREPSCQQSASRAAACFLGEEPQEIPVTLLSRSQLVVQAATGGSPAEIAFEKKRFAALALLDLADPDVTPNQAAATLAARIGAFYDSRTRAITIITEDGDSGPMDGAWNMSLLVHEFTHALQDRAGHLAFPYRDNDTSYDRLMARGALVEGEASYTETRAMLGLFHRDTTDVAWPALFTRVHDLALRATAAAPVPADFAYSYFSYPFGLSTVIGAYQAGGLPAIQDLWNRPPTSARQVLLGASAPELAEGPLVEDLGVDSSPELQAPHAFVAGDRQGAFVWQLFIRRNQRRFLSAVSGRGELRALAARLTGDYLSLFESATAPLAIWRLRFTDEASAIAAHRVLIELESSGVSWRSRRVARDLIIVGHGGSEDPTTAVAWRAPPPNMPSYRLSNPALIAGCPRHSELGAR